MMRLLPIALLLSVTAAGCSGGDTTAVPRPEAFPRIELPVPDYSAPDSLPVSFEVNRADTRVECRTADNGAVWLTVDYPRHGAAIYLTFSAAGIDEAADIAANRYERLTRDIRGAMGRVDALTASADTFTLYATEAAVPTPAAAILVMPAPQGRMVVSGTVSLTDKAFVERPDSMDVVRDYIMEDFWHGFKSAQPWK